MKTVLIVGGVVTVLLILLLREILKSTGDDVVNRLAQAIATAEGFFVVGSRPNRNNNPGNLKQDLTGKAIGRDGELVRYATPDDGWEALKLQVRKFFFGSQFYNPSMTIAQIAQIYTGGDNPEGWAKTVSNKLGVTTSTKLEDV